MPLTPSPFLNLIVYFDDPPTSNLYAITDIFVIGAIWTGIVNLPAIFRYPYDYIFIKYGLTFASDGAVFSVYVLIVSSCPWGTCRLNVKLTVVPVDDMIVGINEPVKLVNE